ncbi:MAG: hypothetical protein UR69_C0001G0114 [Candidatus Moranbacteria bacterium GW2011_GWE2_35_2-]|nr:MAG: hypothetical protein UR69_C0001G0114 [Candidatus Moranbacteria bacterium GW2011_GWE2_35_2-]KKQ04875.1 MAG: hypothetical protein US15_C0040G0004 [Candidatus Moranbacteria bacterium GW2011_GWF1_36_4]KKQ22888.1 MAG: hypothetical protein US37_C0001G0160 [Candidatus Moranbacteria bacterium GW2011_GWF2_37_11]KKQ29246.1 MAG: hypothetical protein US44_C0002G0028 [Candidatus Moranbacteria bacterium GW2011_GWD1_37_17]KKQ30881.1 MAG: hypothetical protein US47_C0001G0114 [Candidatus Moranbacteria b
MFGLIKSIIWIVGFAVVASFALDYFGYEINKGYFSERKGECQQKLKECQKEVLHQGLDNAQCKFDCVDPKLIIKKK